MSTATLGWEDNVFYSGIAFFKKGIANKLKMALWISLNFSKTKILSDRSISLLSELQGEKNLGY